MAASLPIVSMHIWRDLVDLNSYTTWSFALFVPTSQHVSIFTDYKRCMYRDISFDRMTACMRVLYHQYILSKMGNRRTCLCTLLKCGLWMEIKSINSLLGWFNTLTIIRNRFFSPPPSDCRNFPLWGSVDPFWNDLILFTNNGSAINYALRVY